MEKTLEVRPSRQEQKTLFVELRAKGYSLLRCSKELECSKTTMAAWQAELEQEIASLKAMELEALYESFFLAKEARIRMLGSQLQAMQTELESRPLSTVATDKLLELMLKYYQQLKEEFIEPRLSGTGQGSQVLSCQDMPQEMSEVLQRYRAGLLDYDQAKQEMSLLWAMLKAQEQAELAYKLEKLSGILEAR
jgi:hypothetical protein